MDDDYRYSDPRLDRRHDDSPNIMWGWIAGAIVLALLLVFVFGHA